MTGLIARFGVKALSDLQLALLFRVFSGQQFIQLITAYMTEILPLHVVEDKLTIFWQRSPIRSIERAQNSAVSTLGMVRESSIM